MGRQVITDPIDDFSGEFHWFGVWILIGRIVSEKKKSIVGENCILLFCLFSDGNSFYQTREEHRGGESGENICFGDIVLSFNQTKSKENKIMN